MKKIRFAIAQMNATVGDYAGNTAKIMAWIRKAERKRADVIVFPELALSGYPMWDLANKHRFVNEGLRYLDRIVRSTRGKKVSVFLGFIDHGTSGDGRSYNTMAWIEKGKLRGKQHKRLLPTYDVFLEDIFFERGKVSNVFTSKGWRIGPTLCEDLWDSRYEDKPILDLKKKRANLIFNIAASPYFQGAAKQRDLVMKKHAVRHRLPLLYVNQVGGQDDLIFDGRSFFVNPEGRVLFRAPAFEENLFFFDWDPEEKDPYGVPLGSVTGQPEEIYRALVLGIRDYCHKNGFEKAVVGISGGIDSAVTAALAVDALGRDAVMGVTMPGTYSSKGSWKDSEDLAKRLGIEFRVHPIKKKYAYFLKEHRAQIKREGGRLPSAAKISTAMENLQARLRGMELMYLSNEEGRLLLSTGNKSEIAVGYCTLYGDMAGGLCVLGDVYKTDVYRLAWHRNRDQEIIPRSILTKAPSAELRPGQRDEDSLPPYEILDEILYLYIEKNQSGEEIVHHLRSRKIAPQTHS